MLSAKILELHPKIVGSKPTSYWLIAHMWKPTQSFLFLIQNYFPCIIRSTTINHFKNISRLIKLLEQMYETNRIVFLLKFFSQEHNAPGVFLPHDFFLATLFWHFLNEYTLPPFHNEPFIEFPSDIPLPKHVRDNDSNRKLSFFSPLSIVLLQRKGLWVIERLCAHWMRMSIALTGCLMTSGFLAFNLHTSTLCIASDKNALQNIL